MIHAAAKMSTKKACTNVPIKCDFCSEIHWKYNIHLHLQERHASWEQRGDEVKFHEKVGHTRELYRSSHVFSTDL
jgi:hypothetical protein